MVRFATIIAQSEILAEEIVLDVFLKIWQQKNKADAISNIETYLFVSVRNTAINSLKKDQKFHIDMLDDAHIQLVDFKPSADNLLIEHEMWEALNNAVNQLPAKCKMIFKLIREDGLSRNEAAQVLDISAKTIDSQIVIAVRKIAEQLHIDLSNPKNSKGLTTILLTF
ncbi:ECF subfamily RNA polymerase sigma-24 subunit [Sunxiuqinia dokdonensis]|uniref:ECF subfamily RNA polymerase sigma-24 subunit n=2 Tax=Sunxiuqinia dokdonensis TaxID=1409788 RepID=A0A0L8VC96_9BACT|nr:ECF subfamily RNA polymerase sigma-24 subunit [Sunxiuqinia dokdonensis]